MADKTTQAIRVLVVDDEANVRDAYRQILQEPTVNKEIADLNDLRTRLFKKPEGSSAPAPIAQGTAFDPVFCDQAEAAVATVERALAQDRPFAVRRAAPAAPPRADRL